MLPRFLPAFLITFFSFSYSGIKAQDSTWTLRQCIDYALENNISIQQARLQAEINKNNLQTARFDYLPDLSLSTNYATNFGLNIDPVTNIISQQTRRTANLQLQSVWLLYDGGRKYNRIASNNLDYLAALFEYEDAVNDISLNIASGYLQILLNQEIADVAAEQVKVSQTQVRQMRERVVAGANPEGDLFQLEAQLARDSQALVAARNEVLLSKLGLANLLQLEDPAAFAIADPALAVPQPTLIGRSPEGIFLTALESQPGVKGAEKRLASSEQAVDLAQGAYLPSLSVIAQVGSNYSDQIPNVVGTETSVLPIGEVVGTGELVTTLTPQSFPITDGTKPFNDQVSDNLNQFVGINLSLPLFNRLATKNAVQNARLQEEIQRLNYEQEKNTLKQEVYQAHADAKATYNSYQAANEAVKANRKAYEYAQERYAVGAMNLLDYETARNNYVRAQSERAQSKYNYIFRIKVLEFYLTNQVQ